MFPFSHMPPKMFYRSVPVPSPFTAALCGFTCGAANADDLETVLEAVRPLVKTKILPAEGFQAWLLKIFWTGNETPEFVAQQWEETDLGDL